MLYPLTVSKVSAYAEACKYERVFGARALTALHAYGLGSEEAKFYLCMRGRTPCAALHLEGGLLSISSEEHADPSVIADFVRENPVKDIITTWDQCQALQGLLGGTVRTSYYMVYRGGPIEEVGAEVVRGSAEAALAVLRVDGGLYQNYLQDEKHSAMFVQKAAHGGVEIYVIERDGKPVATGSIVGEDEEGVVLGELAVLPEYRGQGLGSAICRRLIQAALEKGKIPRIISSCDEVSELFRKNGFASCGRWGALRPAVK